MKKKLQKDNKKITKKRNSNIDLHFIKIPFLKLDFYNFHFNYLLILI